MFTGCIYIFHAISPQVMYLDDHALRSASWGFDEEQNVDRGGMSADSAARPT